MPSKKLEQLTEYMLATSKNSLQDMRLRLLEQVNADRKRVMQFVDDWVYDSTCARMAEFFLEHGPEWVTGLGSIGGLDVADKVGDADVDDLDAVGSSPPDG